MMEVSSNAILSVSYVGIGYFFYGVCLTVDDLSSCVSMNVCYRKLLLLLKPCISNIVLFANVLQNNEIT